MFYSPLRYPGGKNKLSAFLAKICIENQIHGHYVEPYCGGASVALSLLFEGIVERITINDKDPAIYAFWYSVLNNCNELCDLIDKTNVDLDNWEKQKEIHSNPKKFTLLELGFSTLFLNRCNRSGIIKGGVIGGKSQNGNYLIDCRFNKPEIIRKIQMIAGRRMDITLYQMDALDLIDKIESTGRDFRTIIYFDPPYFLKADSLYMNYYKETDHAEVAARISNIHNVNWIVSYDNHPEVRKLYSPFSSKQYTFNHSAHTSREGREILFFCDRIDSRDLADKNPVNFKIKKRSNTVSVAYKVAARR